MVLGLTLLVQPLIKTNNTKDKEILAHNLLASMTADLNNEKAYK